MAEPQRHTPNNSRLSRTLLEAAQTLSHVQKVERIALEMDAGQRPGPAVVILIPEKLSLEDWQAKAIVIEDAAIVGDGDGEDEAE